MISSIESVEIVGPAEGALRELETQSVRGSGATGKVRESCGDEHVKGSANRRMNLAGCRHGLEDPEAREVGTSWR